MKKILQNSTRILLSLMLLASFTHITYAADPIGQYTLLEPLPCVADSGQNCAAGTILKTITVDNYIQYVYKFSIALAVGLAVFMIALGGFQYVTTESIGIKTGAKERITNAIYGLILVLGSYLILQTIDPKLVTINATLPPITINNDKVDINALITQDSAAIDAANKALDASKPGIASASSTLANAKTSVTDALKKYQDALENGADATTQAQLFKAWQDATTAETAAEVNVIVVQGQAVADATYKLRTIQVVDAARQKPPQENDFFTAVESSTKTILDTSIQGMNGLIDNDIKNIQQVDQNAVQKITTLQETKTYYTQKLTNDALLELLGQASAYVNKDDYANFVGDIVSRLNGGGGYMVTDPTTIIKASDLGTLGKVFKGFNYSPKSDNISYTKLPTYTDPTLKSQAASDQQTLVANLKALIPAPKP